MSEPLTLLRRERGRPRRRQIAALACAAIALAVVAPVVNAEDLQPDASTGPASSGLQPDAFPGSATAKPAAPAVLGDSLAQMPVTPPPAAPKITQPATTPSLHIAVVTRPVTIAPITRAPTQTRVVQRRARSHTVRTVTKHHSAARMKLPTFVSGSFAMPASLRPRAVPIPTVVGRRDLRLAALALLALVATSGCLLAVAARSRREGLESS